MAFFSKLKCVLWPKKETLEVFLDRRENNHFSFDANLWQSLNDTQIQTIGFYFSQNKITSLSVLIPDTIAHTKSFIYDSKIDSIDKKEVQGLAESFINFKINPDYLSYSLVQTESKTIIRATIYEPEKFDTLKTNLEKLGINVDEFISVSSAISKVIATVYPSPAFFLFPSENHESTLSLSLKDSLYLTSNFKGSNLDIQKIINYSKIYFPDPVNKIFLPLGSEVEVESTKPLDKTFYDSAQIATNLNKPSNLPIPVLGVLLTPNSPNTGIIETSKTKNLSPQNPPMQPKKNILPFIAVFIVTAAIASIVLWFLIFRDNTAGLNDPSTQITPVPTTSVEIPTQSPSPTLAEVDKTIKIQVLNATDINGQAATLKSMIAALDFTSIAVGNAAENATENQIQLKPSLSEYGPYFQQQLANQFDATITTDLKETGTYDAVFIIGTKLETPSASPTSRATPTEAEEL